MNETNYQNPSELLHLFLDGELEAGKESLLFSELAGNEELRNEMKDFLLIRNKIKSDSIPVSPPIETSSALFGTLGFNPSVLNPNAVIPFSGLVLSTLKKLWAPVATAIVASLITYFALQQYINNNTSQSHFPMMVSYSINPLIHGNSDNNELNNLSIAENKNTDRLAQNRITSKVDNFTDRLPEKVQFNGVEYSKVEYNSDNLRIINDGGIRIKQIISSYTPQSIFQNTKLKKNDNEYSLQLRGINGISFPSAQVPFKQNTIFSNMSAAFYFARFENIRIGFEFGNEPFGQVFNNKEGGTEWQYTQNAAIYWAGLDVMYIFDKEFFFDDGPQPFVQATLGGTELGPLGKLITGLQYYSKETGIGAMIGIEGTLLSYINQKVWYNTKKIGFTYGMSIHF